ncbi:phospholipase A2-like [Aethina tumida]|uniref:phospholipase A2-like n=1 Tax=Aethina tumida TaxID=116153 RepID=UPI0021472F97|nr:phospholipase A2-like [Aethina tumida]
MFKYIIFIYSSYVVSVQCYKIVWDNSVDFDFNNFDDSNRLGEVRMPNWFFIYPGTKWCGAGNIADNNSDLGLHRDTDKCCRTHDMCPDIIGGHQTKYNLTNPSFYTRLNCDCDKEFYKCLKSVNSRVSTQIGHIYFTALGTQCYENQYPVQECSKYTYFPKRKCVQYEYNKEAKKVYQWFDVPNF